MSTERQFEGRLTLQPVGQPAEDWGIWDTDDGGGKDSEESKYKEGGMGATIALSGDSEVENITLQRLYKMDRDHAKIGKLLGYVGRGVRFVYTKSALDADGHAVGNPIVYKGTFKRCTPPNTDSNSSDPALVSVELTAESVVQQGVA